MFLWMKWLVSNFGPFLQILTLCGDAGDHLFYLGGLSKKLRRYCEEIVVLYAFPVVCVCILNDFGVLWWAHWWYQSTFSIVGFVYGVVSRFLKKKNGFHVLLM